MKLKKLKKGFTLIELLVVIAIIGILATFLIPAVTGALLNAKVTKLLSNGKNIYTAVFAADAEDTFGTTVGFPRTGQFATTHEYFTALVTNEVMSVSYTFFTGPGIDSAPSESAFDADSCAWKVSENVGTGKDGAPFLVTRNYSHTEIPGIAANAATGTDLSDYVGDDTATVLLKFDSDTVVVIQKGGAGLKPKKKDLRNSANINPTEIDYTLLEP